MTRIGRGGKLVLTGDPCQCDHDAPAYDAVFRAAESPESTEPRVIGTVRLDDADVVRHDAIESVIDLFRRV